MPWNEADRAKYEVIRTRYSSDMSEAVAGGVISRRGPWRSFGAVEYATPEWVDWFNNRRIVEPIDNMPPAEAEERYYAALQKQPIAA